MNGHVPCKFTGNVSLEEGEGLLDMKSLVPMGPE